MNISSHDSIFLLFLSRLRKISEDFFFCVENTMIFLLRLIAAVSILVSYLNYYLLLTLLFSEMNSFRSM